MIRDYHLSGIGAHNKRITLCGKDLSHMRRDRVFYPRWMDGDHQICDRCFNVFYALVGISPYDAQDAEGDIVADWVELLLRNIRV